MISSINVKFSIITPSFNQGQFLEQTIKSVLSQTGDFDIEYFIMDGGSTDNSVNIIKKYAALCKDNPRIELIWQSQKDKGQSDAINQGFIQATGDIFASINSDDFYDPGIFSQIKKALKINPNKKWLTGYSHIVNENNQLIQLPITIYKIFWLKLYSYPSLQILNFVSQPSTFFKKELFNQHGPFNETLHLTMDYDFWLKIAKKNPPIILHQYISNFRIHSQSKGKNDYQKQFNEDYSTVKKYTHNQFILFCHRLHNQLITLIYRFIK